LLPTPFTKSYGAKSNGTVFLKKAPLRDDVEILPYTCIQKMPFA
jgi:hypothetical protein